MCSLAQSLAFGLAGIRRRSAGAVMMFVMFGAAVAHGYEPDGRGGRVGWGRLITPDADWAIHSEQDPKLASFIRTETSLNINPYWCSVGVSDLKQLCTYPFLYVKDLAEMDYSTATTNLQEYLKRGGFICVDPCAAHFHEGTEEGFFQANEAYFKTLFPDCEVRDLPDNHPLYHCYFDVGPGDLNSPDMIRRGAPALTRIGMRGVFEGGRMIAILSGRGLECGWPQTPGRVPGCAKMIVNIYVYAMTASSKVP